MRSNTVNMTVVESALSAFCCVFCRFLPASGTLAGMSNELFPMPMR